MIVEVREAAKLFDSGKGQSCNGESLTDTITENLLKAAILYIELCPQDVACSLQKGSCGRETRGKIWYPKATRAICRGSEQFFKRGKTSCIGLQSKRVHVLFSLNNKLVRWVLAATKAVMEYHVSSREWQRTQLNT